MAAPASNKDVDLWESSMLWVVHIRQPLLGWEVIGHAGLSRLKFVASEHVDVGALQLLKGHRLDHRARTTAPNAQHV